jgi:hypothetical protein
VVATTGSPRCSVCGARSLGRPLVAGGGGGGGLCSRRQGPLVRARSLVCTSHFWLLASRSRRVVLGTRARPHSRRARRRRAREYPAPPAARTHNATQHTIKHLPRGRRRRAAREGPSRRRRRPLFAGGATRSRDSINNTRRSCRLAGAHTRRLAPPPLANDLTATSFQAASARPLCALASSAQPAMCALLAGVWRARRRNWTQSKYTLAHTYTPGRQQRQRYFGRPSGAR